jgi:hypothetical protein
MASILFVKSGSSGEKVCLGDRTSFSDLSISQPVPDEDHTRSRLLRFFLGEAAHKAIRTDTELRTFYYRLLNKKETSRAIVSVARKLLVRSFIMLRDGIDYNEFKARGVEARSARTVHRLVDA